MKICHLHLEDGFGNKRTLVCNLNSGSIIYAYYGGWNSSGTDHALSNLQCNLPIDKESEDETKAQFAKRVIDMINKKSVCRVVKEISTEINFSS
jgi:hypothetical protein